ncbi:MAG TPA: succinylglutamate desuccinylase/aspartoacylase family protein [Polyangiaceae bacterium]
MEVRADVAQQDVPADVGQFLSSLERPTVFRIRGRDRKRTRAVTGLLHGNEPSGLCAIHALLRDDTTPAVDVVCIVGAVEAARASKRMLPGRRDLNRCFRPPWDGADGTIARSLLSILDEAHPEALVDLHNNSGHNPPYSIVTRFDEARAGLVSLFAERLITSELRIGSLMEAFAPSLPVATIECGRAGTAEADRVAREGLRRYVSLDALPRPRESPRLTLFGDAVRVTLRPGARVSFAMAPTPGVDLTLDDDVDRHNFSRLPAGTRIGWIRRGATWPLVACNEAGLDVAHALFESHDGALVTAREVIPVMMTTDPLAAATDCLFYVVRELRYT